MLNDGILNFFFVLLEKSCIVQGESKQSLCQSIKNNLIKVINKIFVFGLSLLIY